MFLEDVSSLVTSDSRDVMFLLAPQLGEVVAASYWTGYRSRWVHWMNGRMNGWMDGWMDGWMNG